MSKGYEDFKFTFGKHNGELLSDIPSSYLKWCLEQEWFCEKYAYRVPSVESELEFRDRFDKHFEDRR